MVKHAEFWLLEIALKLDQLALESWSTFHKNLVKLCVRRLGQLPQKFGQTIA